jgi:hypothetical protein
MKQNQSLKDDIKRINELDEKFANHINKEKTYITEIVKSTERGLNSARVMRNANEEIQSEKMKEEKTDLNNLTSFILMRLVIFLGKKKKRRSKKNPNKIFTKILSLTEAGVKDEA